MLVRGTLSRGGPAELILMACGLVVPDTSALSVRVGSPLVRWLGILAAGDLALQVPATFGLAMSVLCRSPVLRADRRDLIGAWQRPH